MAEMLEIRWHGRGGQGAKTAALLLAEAGAAAGRYVQAFPEYGPERMGAPVVSYNRLSTEPITLHSAIDHPRFVVVLDPSFIETIDFMAGVPENGLVIINTDESPDVMRKRLKLEDSSVRIYTLDANTIANETIGRPIPNTPMLGALAAVTGIIELEDLLSDVRSKLEKKFRNKPEVIEGNMEAIRRAYQEVKAQ